MSSQRLLDEVQNLARLEAFDPDAYVAALAGELAPAATLSQLAARDEELRAALGKVDAMIERAMRIHLDRALVDDTSIPTTTRKVFAGTVVAYAHDLGLLERRARDVSLRGDPTGAAAEAVVASARAALALRDRVRGAVLRLVAELAAASVPAADRAARERTREDAERQRWSAARRDLEAVAAEPAIVARAPMADRVAALAVQLDEPEPVPEPTFGELLELD